MLMAVRLPRQAFVIANTSPGPSCTGQRCAEKAEPHSPSRSGRPGLPSVARHVPIHVTRAHDPYAALERATSTGRGRVGPLGVLSSVGTKATVLRIATPPSGEQNLPSPGASTEAPTEALAWSLAAAEPPLPGSCHSGWTFCVLCHGHRGACFVFKI